MSERIAEANDALFLETTLDAVALRCECGHQFCSDAIVVTVEEHRRARGAHALLVSVRHANDARVLEVSDRYALVAGE